MASYHPYQTIASTGARIPGIGVGTFGSDHADPQNVAAAVAYAIEIGYRHIDCAAVYNNEKEIGRILNLAMDAGRVSREELWVTGKLWNDMHSSVREAFMRSLGDLGLDYLDLYLVHWPFPNYHPPFCDVSSRSPHARPYIHEKFMQTWRIMEELRDEGLVKHIGVSNMTVPKMELLLRDARIKPDVLEMELHPHFQQKALSDYCREHDIVRIGYCPLGSPSRPERDKTPEDTVDMEDPVIVAMARARGVHPAAICLKWAVANGHIPIPFSLKEKNINANLEAVTSAPLTEEEKKLIDGIDRNCRLIKGHVFLWEGATDWHDLWDENGEITR